MSNQVLKRAVVMAAALIACVGLASEATARDAATAAGPAASHAWHLYGKPRPPVDVMLDPGAALSSGVPGQVILQVRAGIAMKDLRLAVQGDPGLSVVGTAQPLAASGTPGQGSTARFQVAVTPTSGGTRYLSGLLTFDVNGVRQGVPFRLALDVAGPVTVAPVHQKPARMPYKDATGRLIDSMPAETTVQQ